MTGYSSEEMRRVLGEMAENVKRHRNRASSERQKRQAWRLRALEAEALLREVSAANSDGDGGHESLWDAVDAFVAALNGRKT